MFYKISLRHMSEFDSCFVFHYKFPLHYQNLLLTKKEIMYRGELSTGNTKRKYLRLQNLPCMHSILIKKCLLNNNED